MADNSKMDRNLALEAVRVTEVAALSASRLMGRGDEKAADQAAVDAMREALNSLSIAGTVVIGEGERDEAPMLYIGEKVGSGNGPPIDIALDPLEGTTITAKGDVMFAATGVTSGTMLQGVRRVAGGAVTHSMVMRSKSGTVRIIEAQHNLTRKTGFLPAEK